MFLILCIVKFIHQLVCYLLIHSSLWVLCILCSVLIFVLFSTCTQLVADEMLAWEVNIMISIHLFHLPHMCKVGKKKKKIEEENDSESFGMLLFWAWFYLWKVSKCAQISRATGFLLDIFFSISKCSLFIHGFKCVYLHRNLRFIMHICNIWIIKNILSNVVLNEYCKLNQKSNANCKRLLSLFIFLIGFKLFDICMSQCRSTIIIFGDLN